MAAISWTGRQGELFTCESSRAGSDSKKPWRTGKGGSQEKNADARAMLTGVQKLPQDGSTSPLLTRGVEKKKHTEKRPTHTNANSRGVGNSIRVQRHKLQSHASNIFSSPWTKYQRLFCWVSIQESREGKKASATPPPNPNFVL